MIGLIIGELKFFDILEEVNKEEQTTIETLFDRLKKLKKK